MPNTANIKFSPPKLFPPKKEIKHVWFDEQVMCHHWAGNTTTSQVAGGFDNPKLTWLVVLFNPSEKYARQNGVPLPQGSGWKFQKYLSCHHQTNEFLSNLSFSFSRGHQLWHENPKTNAPIFVREMGPSNFPHRNFIAFQLRMCHSQKKNGGLPFHDPAWPIKIQLPKNGFPFGNPPQRPSTSPGFCTQRNTPGGTSSYYSKMNVTEKCWDSVGFFSPNCFFANPREMAHGSYLSMLFGVYADIIFF